MSDHPGDVPPTSPSADPSAGAMDGATAGPGPLSPTTPVEPAPVAGESTDPWAHRRGEPRIFAFLWTVYVLVCVAGSLLWLSRATRVTIGTYSPAARIMLVVVAAGMVLLWPMVRLSQERPRGWPVASALADWFVVQLPVQMVVWPLIVLANWPVGTVGALSALFALWGLLVAGVLALAYTFAGGPGDESGAESGAAGAAWRGRWVWMAGMVVLALAAPVLLAATWTPESRIGMDPVRAMFSPLSAIPVLTGTGFSGPENPVTSVQWTVITGVGVAGVIFLAASVLRGGLSGDDERA
jgi:hypothetical protein